MLIRKIRKVLKVFLNLSLNLNLTILNLNLAIFILRIAAIYYSCKNWYNTIYRLDCHRNTGLRLKGTIETCSA
jgi:hypothetical protein